MFSQPRVPFGGALKRDLIQQTAQLMFGFRILEGLGAWVLFNEVFLEVTLNDWPIHLLFIVYFAINSIFYLRYRSGRISSRLVIADIIFNLTTMTILTGYSGGLASPVALIILFKIAGYAFVFSAQAGMAAIAGTFIGFAVLIIGEAAGAWSMIPIDVLPVVVERRIELAFRISVLSVMLTGAAWLLKQIADTEDQLRREAKRAKDAAHRERAAASMTGALLAVSEAVSRLTRLDEILNKVVEVAPRVLGVHYCGIFLWDDQSETYRGAAVSGVEPALANELMGMCLKPTDVPDLEWVRRLGHCAVIAPQGVIRLGAPEAPTLLTAPLLSGGRFYGVMQFARRGGKDSFTQRDLTIADGVAGQTAVALERARLVEESRRLVRAVESTGEAVLITDRQRRIVFVNQAFQQTFGYTWAELRGMDSLQLGSDLPADWVREVSRRVIEQSWRGEAVAQRKDGSPFPVALHASLIRAEDGRIEGAVAILADITAQKDLQEQLQRTDRLAAAGELAAGVAHEVNNALAGILGQAAFAENGADADALRAALRNVEIQGHRIADIVQGLLGFARPKPPERTPLDVRQLVRDTLALMAHDLGRSGVRSELRFAPELPAVLADAKQIQQVLVNLFTNAMQAMEPLGGGPLLVSIQSRAEQVCVEVHDGGAGIPPDVLPRIFNPFFSTKPKGTGLGLSVSYAIVRAHGGELSVRSNAEEGTVFTLALPAVATTPLAQPRTVLLVDDDPAVAETLCDMLKREGLAVQRAATGGEALAIVANADFDAIFLDVRLPDISGPEIYARLAADRPQLARRVIFVTGGLWRLDSRGLRDKLPGQPTLSKPCTGAQIREVLRLLQETRVAA